LSPGESLVQIPNVPIYGVARREVLVTLPGDAARVSQADARAVADTYAQAYGGTREYNAVVLARLQVLNADGTVKGPPGPPQWEFVIIGQTSFAGRARQPMSRATSAGTATSAPYPYPAHYCIISINADTGEEDGIVLMQRRVGNAPLKEGDTRRRPSPLRSRAGQLRHRSIMTSVPYSEGRMTRW
jgi:hypothetical protein